MSSKVKNADVVASAEFSADRDWRFVSFNRDIRECPEVKQALKVLGLRYAHRRTEENAGHSVYYSPTPIKVDTLVKALPMVAIHNNGTFVPPLAPAPVKPMVSGKSGKVRKGKIETVKSVQSAPAPAIVAQNTRTNLDRMAREIKLDLPFCSVAELRTMHTAESGGQHRRNVLANLRDALIERKAELVETAPIATVETVKPVASVNGAVKDTIKYAPVESEPTAKPTNTAVFAAMGAALRAMADVLESLQ